VRAALLVTLCLSQTGCVLIGGWVDSNADMERQVSRIHLPAEYEFVRGYSRGVNPPFFGDGPQVVSIYDAPHPPTANSCPEIRDAIESWRVISLQISFKNDVCFVSGRVVPGLSQILIWQRSPYSLNIGVRSLEYPESSEPRTRAQVHLYDSGWY